MFEKILITGAGGYVGTVLTKELLEVIITTKKPLSGIIF